MMTRSYVGICALVLVALYTAESQVTETSLSSRDGRNGVTSRLGNSVQSGRVVEDRSNVYSNRKGYVVVTPSVGTTLSFEEKQRLWIMQQRNKQRRIFALQQHVYEHLAPRRRMNITSQNLTQDRIKEIQSSFSRCSEMMENDDDYLIRKCQNMLPSCPLPKRVSKLQNGENGFKLYFSIVSPDIDRSKEIKVTSATLQLKKKTNRINNSRAGSRSTRKQKSKAKPSTTTTTTTTTAKPLNISNSFNVSIFAFVHHKNSNGQRVEQRLVKSTIVQKKFNGWVRMNIKRQVQEWFRQTRKNLGLQVVVLDDQNRQIDPFQIFESYNCSSTKTKHSTAAQNRRADFNRLASSDTTNRPNLDIVTTIVEKKRSSSRRRSRHCN